MSGTHSDQTAALNRWEAGADLPMLVLALASVPLLVFESLHPLLFVVLNWTITAIFVVELGTRLVLHGPGRRSYAASIWYDFAIVGLTLIPVLTPLRALRSVRVLKVLKVLRLAAFVERGRRTVRRVWSETSGRWVVVAASALVGVSAIGVWFFEDGGGGDIDSLGETAWWTVVTMTTVGYGDISPTTSGGKIAATFLMFSGITVFGVVTANLAARFTRTEEGSLEDQIEKLTASVAQLSDRLESIDGAATFKGMTESRGQQDDRRGDG